MNSSSAISVKPSSLSSSLNSATTIRPPAKFYSHFHTCNLNFSLHNNNSTLKATANRNPSSPFPCATSATSTPASTSDLSASRLDRLISEFELLTNPVDRLKRLLGYADCLPSSDDSKRTAKNCVMGCTAQVWLDARMDEKGAMRFWADSDLEVTRRFCRCLCWVLDGASPEEILRMKTDDLEF